MKNAPTRTMITPACSTNAVSRSETSPFAAAWPSATSAAAANTRADDRVLPHQRRVEPAAHRPVRAPRALVGVAVAALRPRHEAVDAQLLPGRRLEREAAEVPRLAQVRHVRAPHPVLDHEPAPRAVADQHRADEDRDRGEPREDDADEDRRRHHGHVAVDQRHEPGDRAAGRERVELQVPAGLAQVADQLLVLERRDRRAADRRRGEPVADDPVDPPRDPLAEHAQHRRDALLDREEHAGRGDRPDQRAAVGRVPAALHRAGQPPDDDARRDDEPDGREPDDEVAGDRARRERRPRERQQARRSRRATAPGRARTRPPTSPRPPCPKPTAAGRPRSLC